MIGDPASPETTQMVFKTEEDQLAAINALPETPPADVTDVEAWHAEQEVLTDKIENAKIDANHVPADPDPNKEKDEDLGGKKPEKPVQKSEESGGDDDWYKAEDWTFQYKGEDVVIPKEDLPAEPEERKKFTFRNAKDAFVGLVNTQRYLDSKTREHSQTVAGYTEQIKSLEEKQAELQTKLDEVERGKPGKLPDGIPTDADLSSMKTQLDDINGKVDAIDDDNDPELMGLMRKSNKLTRQYNALRDKRTDYDAGERVRQAKEAKEAREADAKRDRETQERQERLAKSRSALDAFQQTEDGKALNLGMTYAQAEEQYVNFGTEVAALDWGIPPKDVDWPKLEQSMARYLGKNPRLMDKLVENGVAGREPKAMRKYLILSEVDQYKLGKTLDPSSGNWTQHSWSHPDLDTAYYHWKREKGIKAQELVEAAEKGADELLKAIQAPGVVELQHGDGGTQNQEVKTVGKEEALKNFDMLEKQAKEAGYADADEWIEMISRKNAEDPRVKMYDKSLAALEA